MLEAGQHDVSLGSHEMAAIKWHLPCWIAGRYCLHTRGTASCLWSRCQRKYIPCELKTEQSSQEGPNWGVTCQSCSTIVTYWWSNKQGASPRRCHSCRWGLTGSRSVTQLQFRARQLQSILHQLFYSVLPTSDTVTQGAIEHQQVGALPLLMLCGSAMAPHCKQCLYTRTDAASETESRKTPSMT